MAHQILSDLDFNSVSKITNLPNAVGAQEPVTLSQLQAIQEGIAWKDNVTVASAANVNLAAPGASIDGITLAANDRVLIKSQTAQAENGIYIFNGAATPMTRALDMSSSLEFNSAVVPVDLGTSAGSQFRQTAVAPTVGTTAIVFTNFASSSPAASETVSGIAEIATQAETDAGTDDLRIVTPLKMATYAGRVKKFSAQFGDGAATSYAITHNLNTFDVEIQVYRNSGNRDTVLCDVNRTTVNQITLVFSSAPAANAFRVVVVG